MEIYCVLFIVFKIKSEIRFTKVFYGIMILILLVCPVGEGKEKINWLLLLQILRKGREYPVPWYPGL